MSLTQDKLFRLQRGLQELEEIVASQNLSVEMAKIATQVSHDLRSPLATLLSVAHHSESLDEKTRSEIHSVAHRIRDIANSLVRKNHKLTQSVSSRAEPVLLPSSDTRNTELLSELIDILAAEIRVQFGNEVGLDLSTHNKSIFGVFVEFHFAEVLRSLIQAVKAAQRATHELCRIELRCEAKGRRLHLLLLSQGRLFGSCELRVIDSPKWFPQIIELGSTVVIVDDETAVHELWQRRLEKTKGPLPHVINCCSADEILAWYRANFAKVDDVLYLFDLELRGSKSNGLDLIDMMGIARDAILVTGRSSEEEIRQRCSKKGIRLLPKALVPFVPVKRKSDV